MKSCKAVKIEKEVNLQMDKLIDILIINAIGQYSRTNREPFKNIFPNAEMISKEKWLEYMENNSLDFEPIKASIASGEYGNCVLIIFADKCEPCNNDLYLQWTYQHKGCLMTDYYQIKKLSAAIEGDN